MTEKEIIHLILKICIEVIEEDHTGIMDYVQRWKCSWSMVAIVASIVALVSVVHVFLYPVVPSFDYLSVRHAQNSCIPINESTKGGKDNVLNLDARFPADLHRAVVYRGAPWKSEIGRWLSGCNPITTTIKVVEVVGVMLV